ncbi:Glycosyl transferases group 1 [Humidesulfovibrio mexicanus]|uniref:Glycosyl transferases group 1 n=1 Tax=Humidesulfovibrio mexicanus TaxID=147047 RepID=A0A238Y6C2_9BACT|nr:methyltransferase domain-containing protein [Humidesulfovibrio mexicanus]SNR66657.1 Glycosyl transferases group 1 [Humidesulfovibrio mexicanus]
MSTIIHIVPDSVSNAGKAYVGSTKDVACRTEFFASRGIKVSEYLCRRWADADALEHLKGADLSRCKYVVFEYETFVESLAYLKEEHPHIRRVVRAHNANLPHFVDYYRGMGRILRDKPNSMAPERFPGCGEALRRYQLDVRCTQLADVMLPICQWEATHYWSRLQGACPAVCVPYYLPEKFGSQLPRQAKSDLFVCFMGTGGLITPLLYDSARNTIELVESLPDHEADSWVFCVTGVLRPKNILGRLNRVVSTGRLPSPMPILAQARIVSILSDLGMGFKTKILEAVEAGCWVMVTPDVARRLPEAVLPHCLVVAADDSGAFRAALKAARTPPPASRANEELRAEAFRAMDGVFAEALPLGRVASVAVMDGATASPLFEPEDKGASGDLPPYLTQIVADGQRAWEVFVEPATRRFNGQPGERRMIHYGCGLGGVVYAAAQAGWRVMGVERSQTFLRIASQAFGPAAEFRAMGGHGEISCDSGWADLVFSEQEVCGLATLDELGSVLSEAFRVLRPGGAFRFFFIPWPWEENSLRSRCANLFWSTASRHYTLELRLRAVAGLPPMVPQMTLRSYDKRTLGYLMLPLWDMDRLLMKAGFAIIKHYRTETTPLGCWITAYRPELLARDKT